MTRIHLAARHFRQHRGEQQASALIDEPDLAIFRSGNSRASSDAAVIPPNPDPRIMIFVPPGSRRWTAFTSDLRQTPMHPTPRRLRLGSYRCYYVWIVPC